MKKKFSLEIKSPCQENFNTMIPNTNGSFCNSCAKNVIDLSTKTNHEVATFISNNKSKNICAKLKISQLEQEFEYNEISKTNNLKYAVAVAATLLLTTNVVSQEKVTVKTEIGCAKPNRTVMGKIAYAEPKKNTLSFILKGRILEKATKKPLSGKKYPKLTIYISGISANVNPKTGAYSIPLTIDQTTKELYITISTSEYSFSKSVPIELPKNQQIEQTINILIHSETEMKSHMILGGLGVNYIELKKTNLLS